MSMFVRFNEFTDLESMISMKRAVFAMEFTFSIILFRMIVIDDFCLKLLKPTYSNMVYIFVKNTFELQMERTIKTGLLLFSK